MRWKQSLTPLENVPSLDEGRVCTLRTHHITTAEELVGQIEASPDDIGHLLHMAAPDVRALCRRALSVSNPDIARAMADQRGRKYRFGALPPTADRTGR